MKQFRHIDDYIAAQPAGFRPKLERIRQNIQKIVPDAEECISYGMPAFRYHGMLAYFAAFKNHYSLFFGPAVTAAFAKELKAFETSKATIKIPADQDVPLRLLARLTKYAAARNLEKARLPKLPKKSQAKKSNRRAG